MTFLFPSQPITIKLERHKMYVNLIVPRAVKSMKYTNNYYFIGIILLRNFSVELRHIQSLVPVYEETTWLIVVGSKHGEALLNLDIGPQHSN